MINLLPQKKWFSISQKETMVDNMYWTLIIKIGPDFDDLDDLMMVPKSEKKEEKIKGKYGEYEKLLKENPETENELNERPGSCVWMYFIFYPK